MPTNPEFIKSWKDVMRAAEGGSVDGYDVMEAARKRSEDARFAAAQREKPGDPGIDEMVRSAIEVQLADPDEYNGKYIRAFGTVDGVEPRELFMRKMAIRTMENQGKMIPGGPGSGHSRPSSGDDYYRWGTGRSSVFPKSADEDWQNSLLDEPTQTLPSALAKMGMQRPPDGVTDQPRTPEDAERAYLWYLRAKQPVPDSVLQMLPDNPDITRHQ